MTSLRRLRGALKSILYSGPRRDRWQHPDRVIAALDLRPGQHVADLGAGGGYFTFRLARAVGPQGAVYAVDSDRDMLELIEARAARRGCPNVRTAAPDRGQPLPATVDLVLMVDSFHHLPEETPYYARLAGQLTAGGRLAIIESLPRWYLFGHATEPDRIRSVLSEAGYRVADAYDFLPRQSFTVFTKVDPP
jgi:arsenite methyltransferase